MPQVSLFTLEVNRWYSWHMLPGYGGDFLPYVSPILIRNIKLLKSGKGELELEFFNAFYSQGVQNFKKRLRVLTRRSHHLLAVEIGNDKDAKLTGRDVVIGQLSFDWLKRFLNEWYAERPSSLDISGHFMDAENYLSVRFFGTEYPWRTVTDSK